MSRVATVNFDEQVDNDTFFLKRFNFFQADGITALDLSDATVRIQVRKGSAQGKLVQTSVSGDGITWVSQVAGQFDWGAFNISWGGAGVYYYDIQMTYATSGYVRTYVKGIITVIDDVTANA